MLGDLEKTFYSFFMIMKASDSRNCCSLLSISKSLWFLFTFGFIWFTFDFGFTYIVYVFSIFLVRY